MGYDDSWSHMDGGWMVAGGLIWIALLVLIVVGILVAVRAWVPRAAPPYPPRSPDPLDALDERLARGAIDVDEYDRVRERLVRGR